MKRLLLLIVILASAGLAEAQPGGGPPPDPGQPLPISGIEVLLVGGAIFGASRMLLSRKNSKDQQNT